MKDQKQNIYITPAEAAELLRCTRRTLATYEQRPDWPAAYKPTQRKTLYKRSDVLSWIEKQGGQK